ncbi:FUSC family protein [Sphaerotilus uruguayifluvii]|uniref:Membrane protein YccC n=1 Tax=Sphaerotilus uruguayifluvii TaxID=2735897 RepID=A0ABX2FXL6_9BURK|nr:FUSC family protein [Leptothrix sp. C29]NRT54765.1 putative membrane protein YccC [Leptothrix sp. C29]
MSFLSSWRDPRRWPARALNGAAVALGVGLIQLAGGLLGGPAVALAMSGGAVCTSLPDVPNAPQRTWRRMLPAALLVSAVTLATTLWRADAWTMALLVAGVTLLTQMTLAWGPRAGALAFSGTLSLVFALAGPVPADPGAALHHAGWTLAGALAYAGWAQLCSHLLRRRWRELATAQALRAVAARLRSRAQRIAQSEPADEALLQASIRDDVTLAETLQAARDLVFAARPSAHSRRLTDLVLQLIELRDLLLASRLDLAQIGHDAPAAAWRAALAAALRPAADALEQLADAVGRPGVRPRFEAAALRARLLRTLAAVPVAADDPRRPLVQTVGARMAHLLEEVESMVERAGGPDRPARLAPQALQLFVSPEGWPLAALRPHLRLDSPVLRHALRATLACTGAWLLAQVLPWRTHPYWLLLSVAVVLRGNLEQTLARRNQRLLGTVLGCLLTAALMALDRPHWLPWIFLVAVGTAHANVIDRYLVTATAATLMALLQPLMVQPGSHPALAERLADTAIGALLAWAACFVLPSWERRTLRRQTAAVLQALADHARQISEVGADAAAQLRQRQSRARAYAVLGALAASAQRARAEPRWARVPEAPFEALLSHGYTLMALLGTVQQTLHRRSAQLDAGRIAPALQAMVAQCRQTLQPDGSTDPAASAAPLSGDAAAIWPAQDAQADLTPWFERRLRLCTAEAQALGDAARQLLAAAP